MTPSTNNYLSPSATFSDPVPGRRDPAAERGGGRARPRSSGNTISFLNPKAKSPYSLRWNFGFQHSLSKNMVLEAVYIGNHSVHTPINLTQLNGIPRQYLSTLPVRDTALNTAMSASVANPFNGLVTSGTPAGSHHHRGAAALEISRVSAGLHQRRIQRQRRRPGAEPQRGQLLFPQLERARPAAAFRRHHADRQLRLFETDGPDHLAQRHRSASRKAHRRLRPHASRRDHRDLRAARWARAGAVGDPIALAQPAGGRMAAQRHLHQAERPALHLDGNQFHHHRRPGVFRRQAELQPARDQRAGVQYQRLRHARPPINSRITSAPSRRRSPACAATAPTRSTRRC